MASQNYVRCEANVLLSEGGYTNDPQDKGGPTNWGITIYDARAYWKKNATAEDVRAMPRSVAQDIYRAKYWNALNCDGLPAGLDYVEFDYGVNSGISRSGKVLRRVLDLPDRDWHIDGTVLLAVQGHHDVADLINRICDERLAFLKSLKTWPHFGGGWLKRVSAVRKISLSMAATAPLPQPMPTPAPPPSPPSPPPPSPPVPTPQEPTGKGVESIKDFFAHAEDQAKWLFQHLGLEKE